MIPAKRSNNPSGNANGMLFLPPSHAVTTVPIAISAIDRWNQKTFPITMPFANALSPTSGVAISIAPKTDASVVWIPCLCNLSSMPVYFISMLIHFYSIFFMNRSQRSLPVYGSTDFQTNAALPTIYSSGNKPQ